MKSIGPVAALLSLAASPARAAADDVAALRAELQALKSEYTGRVESLEQRIQQLETAAAAAADASAAVAPPPPEPAAPASGGGATAFNPAISLILGGSFTGSS